MLRPARPAPLTVVFALFGLCACGAPGDSADFPHFDSLVVPATPGNYFVFSRHSIDHREADQVKPLAFDLGGAGAPTSTGLDPAGGWAAVAYEHRLFGVQLTESEIRPIESVEWSTPPRAIGVRGGLIGSVEDNTIGLYRIADGKRLWKAPSRDLLSILGLKEIRYVLPESADRLLVVGYKPQAIGGYPQISVMRVDKGEGGASVSANSTIGDIHWLRDCSSDGEHLFLAGEFERPRISPRGDRELIASLVVVSVDPERLATHVVVRDESEEVTRVRQVSTGYGLLALSMEGGHVIVYRLREGTGERIYQARFSMEVSVACIDANHVVLGGPERIWSQTVGASERDSRP